LSELKRLLTVVRGHVGRNVRDMLYYMSACTKSCDKTILTLAAIGLLKTFPKLIL